MSFQYVAPLVLEAAFALFTVYVVYAQATRMPALVKSRERLHYPQWYWNLSTVMVVIGVVTVPSTAATLTLRRPMNSWLAASEMRAPAKSSVPHSS
jgi:hypothetical protein